MRSKRLGREAAMALFLERPADAFWANVDRAGACWEWTGHLSLQGYGLTSVTHMDELLTHRCAKALELGRPLLSSECVLHHCDNRKCVRPSHLYLGTRTDNARDKVRRMRHRFGNNHQQAILTEDDVKQIRNLRQAGVDRKTIAQQFGISVSHVSGVVYRRAWAHV